MLTNTDPLSDASREKQLRESQKEEEITRVYTEAVLSMGKPIGPKATGAGSR